MSLADVIENNPQWTGKFCSVREIAHYLGVSKGRISQYVDMPWWPTPVDYLGTGRIWSFPEVVAAWETHKAAHGRHRPPADYATDIPEETP